MALAVSRDGRPTGLHRNGLILVAVGKPKETGVGRGRRRGSTDALALESLVGGRSNLVQFKEENNHFLSFVIIQIVDSTRLRLLYANQSTPHRSLFIHSF